MKQVKSMADDMMSHCRGSSSSGGGGEIKNETFLRDTRRTTHATELTLHSTMIEKKKIQIPHESAGDLFFLSAITWVALCFAHTAKQFFFFFFLK